MPVEKRLWLKKDAPLKTIDPRWAIHIRQLGIQVWCDKQVTAEQEPALLFKYADMPWAMPGRIDHGVLPPTDDKAGRHRLHVYAHRATEEKVPIPRESRRHPRLNCRSAMCLKHHSW